LSPARARRAACIGAAALAVLGLPWSDVRASATRYCDHPAAVSTDDKDKLLRFGAVIKAELEAAGTPVALISRSGLDLGRFGYRYSHAGISLRAGPETRWAVRQLYYACEERRPRIFDQGLSAFLMGTDDPALGYVSLLLLPAPAADALERAALDKRQALQVLAADYSANAYPYSLRYQNCNQWVIELLATAWGHLDGGAEPRAQAQAWLQQQGYEPSVFALDSRPLMWLGAFIPWVHSDDHPTEDLARLRYRVSMPASIEDFVRSQVLGATRIEICHSRNQVVVRHGWTAIPTGCIAEEGDSVLALD
jgi:hypothetical protein